MGPTTTNIADPLRIAEAVIEQLANDEARHLDTIATLQGERDAYRALACEGIQANAALTRERDNLRRQHAALRTEFAEFRARILSTPTQHHEVAA